MKILVNLMLTIFVALFFSCGQSKHEKELQDKLDSIKIADSIAKIEADEQEIVENKRRKIQEEAIEYVIQCYAQSWINEGNYWHRNCYSINNDDTHYEDFVVKFYSKELKKAYYSWEGEGKKYYCTGSIFYEREDEDGCCSWSDFRDVQWNIVDAVPEDELHATVNAEFSYKLYCAYDDGDFIHNTKHHDTFKILKENNNWTIDDFILDGKSYKALYKANDRRFDHDEC